jgi:hypothetical protein
MEELRPQLLLRRRQTDLGPPTGVLQIATRSSKEYITTQKETREKAEIISLCGLA